MGNAARKQKTEIPAREASYRPPVQDSKYWKSQNLTTDGPPSERVNETEDQRGLFSTLEKEEVDLLRDLQIEVKQLKDERDTWRNKASELQEELRGRDRYIQGANAIADGNPFDYQKFMDELTASRIARHRKIEELNKSKKNKCKKHNDFKDWRTWSSAKFATTITTTTSIYNLPLSLATFYVQELLRSNLTKL